MFRLSSSIILSFIFFYLVGCRSGMESEKSMVVYGYDFTKYSKEGFLFTPEKYPGDYESIALIELSLYPSVKMKPYDEYIAEIKRVTSLESWDTWKRDEAYNKWRVGVITASDVLDSLFTYSQHLGANAVVNLKIESTDPVTNGEVIYRGIRVSGFAIRRK